MTEWTPSFEQTRRATPTGQAIPFGPILFRILGTAFQRE
jgi:hypothetical protein